MTVPVLRIAATLALLFCNTALADGPVMAIGPDGKPMAVAQPSASPSKAGPKGGDNGEKKPDGAASKDGEKDGAKMGEKPPEPKVIRRDETTNDNSDPDELKAMVGEDGRVAFQFRNQPWVELVQWLADISDKPLDWLELPGDRVNMRSPGRYTVEETRDLFNRYLLARVHALGNRWWINGRQDREDQSRDCAAR